MTCWPQACLVDWAAYPPVVWAVTLAVALLSALLAVGPLALLAGAASLLAPRASRLAPQ